MTTLLVRRCSFHFVIVQTSKQQNKAYLCNFHNYLHVVESTGLFSGLFSNGVHSEVDGPLLLLYELSTELLADNSFSIQLIAILQLFPDNTHFYIKKKLKS